MRNRSDGREHGGRAIVSGAYDPPSRLPAMRMKSAILGLWMVLAGCSSEPVEAPLWGDSPAESLDLRAELSSASAPLLGDVELTLDLFEGPGRDVPFEPAIPEGFGGSVERRFERSLGEDRGTWTRFSVQLQPVETGELTIPPFEVRDEDDRVATTPEFVVTVSSVLADAEPDVEAPAPLFPSRFKDWWLAGGIAAGVLLLAALLFWWARRRKRRPAPDAIAIPPHIKALRELSRLRDAPRRSHSEVEVFYVAVSQVLRVYLEDRFGLRAPERTTEEFLPEVEQSGALDTEQRAHLRQFLEQCDLVKFAAMHPDETVHGQTFDFAESFVESTRPDRLRAPESAEPAAEEVVAS